MIKHVISPDLGDAEATVRSLHVSEGDQVKRGDSLVTIELNQELTTIESTEDGIIQEVFVETGLTIESNNPILDIISIEEAFPLAVIDEGDSLMKNIGHEVNRVTAPRFDRLEATVNRVERNAAVRGKALDAKLEAVQGDLGVVKADLQKILRKLDI